MWCCGGAHVWELGSLMGLMMPPGSCFIADARRSLYPACNCSWPPPRPPPSFFRCHLPALCSEAPAVALPARVCARRPTERTGKLTYCAVMEHEWGRWAGAAVRFSIIVGSAGFLVLYLIVLADLLVGEVVGHLRKSGSGVVDGGRRNGYCKPARCQHAAALVCCCCGRHGWRCLHVRPARLAPLLHSCRCTAVPQARSSTAASSPTSGRSCPTRCPGTCSVPPCSHG